MPLTGNGAVLLRDLAESRELLGLEVLHLASPMGSVRDLALVTDVEEIAAVGPDTVVLITREVARGGWMISAALRYAWERKACALIVPQQSTTDTVTELARRLDVSLLTAASNMTRLAIDMAMQIGVARAGVLSRVQSFSDRLAREATLNGALDCVSAELGGSPVAIETAGTTAFQRGLLPALADAPDQRPGERITVPLDSSTASEESVVAHVTGIAETYARHILEAAGPPLRALLARSRLHALQASLPVMDLSTATGASRERGLGAPQMSPAQGSPPWPLGGRYVAVCIISDDVDRAASAVHHLWSERFESLPLARFSDGWFGCIPVVDDEDRRRFVADVNRRVGRSPSPFPMIGVSLQRERSEDAVRAIREAWLAARVADPNSPSPVVDFGHLDEHLLRRLVPQDFARQCVEALYPRLVDDDSAAEVIEAVVAYLECCGSAKRAAQQLDVHRNTLHSRLRRAEILGVDLSARDRVLDTFLLLAALRKG